MPHQVTPPQRDAARRPHGRQSLGMSCRILAIRHHAALRSVVASELRRETARLRPLRSTPRLPLMRALHDPAFRCAQDDRITGPVPLQRCSHGQEWKIQAFHNRARFALHIDAKAEGTVRRGFHDTGGI